MFELVDNVPQSAVIKVIGVGGGGGNAVNHMIKNNIEGVTDKVGGYKQSFTQRRIFLKDTTLG